MASGFESEKLKILRGILNRLDQISALSGPQGLPGGGGATPQNWEIVIAWSANEAITQVQADAPIDESALVDNLVVFGSQAGDSTQSYANIGVPVTSPDITSIVNERSGAEDLGTTGWRLAEGEYTTGINHSATPYKWLRTRRAAARSLRSFTKWRVFQGTRLYSR